MTKSTSHVYVSSGNDLTSTDVNPAQIDALLWENQSHSLKSNQCKDRDPMREEKHTASSRPWVRSEKEKIFLLRAAVSIYSGNIIKGPWLELCYGFSVAVPVVNW